MKETKERIFSSVIKVERWLEDHNYKGYDPADGLTSYLRPLSFGNLLLDRLLQQLIWRSPVNLRPLLGVKPLDSFIGRGYIARAQLIMHKLTGDNRYRQKAAECLEWLMIHKAPGHENYCWGKMFDFASRGGRQHRFEPITVWTSLIGQAFLDSFESTGNRMHLEIAESICAWILSVPRTRTSTGFCINYTGSGKGDCTIHNQSMLAAAMLVRTAKYSGSKECLSTAREAIKYTCSRQLPDGSWFYGEDRKFHWIDNFHSAYNLDALKTYIELTDDRTYSENLKRGYTFYKDNFFENNGRPKYYHNKTFPIDSQCAAQAIDTLTYFSDYDEGALELAVRVAKWTIDNMQSQKTGHFYFMRYPYAALKVPMIHWAQATTYKALAYLLSKL